MSPNQGQVWNLMAGGIGNPLIVDTAAPARTSTRPADPTPNGAQGRIVLAKPAPTGNAVQDAVYAGWLYAAVATPAGGLYGLYMTKDFGQNWTQVRIPTLPPAPRRSVQPGHPHQRRQPGRLTRSSGRHDFPQGNYDITLTVDPTNPNIVYLGGTARRQRPDRADPRRHHRRSGTPTPWSPISNNAKDGGAIDLAARTGADDPSTIRHRIG